MEKLKYDENLLKELRKQLKNAIEKDPTKTLGLDNQSLKYCLDLIENLRDENDSLWDLLDELQKSDINNYQPQFQKAINKKLMELRLLTAIKITEA
jgi:transcription elongation factor GreA-like protein